MCLGPGLLPYLDSPLSAYMMPIIVCTIPYMSRPTTLHYGYLEHSYFCSSVAESALEIGYVSLRDKFSM